MNPISRIRFDAIAGYARGPRAHVDGQELAYFDHADGHILGIIVRDRIDGDYGGLVFAPDNRQRYRCVYVTSFKTTQLQAETRLHRALKKAADAAPTDHHQGDEIGDPIDFFALQRPPSALNRDFVSLADLHGYVPARRIIEPMMRWYDDVDGNFIEQFQTTGFDQRIWELYLFATFTEMGYVLDRRHAIPDYMLQGPFGQIAVEAVTVTASQSGELAAAPAMETAEDKMAFLCEFMPIKFGSALFSKLNKRYQDKENVVGKPLVFAIEDFSSPGSMTWTRSALPRYLYGYDHEVSHDKFGKIVVTPRKICEHRWGKKVIPSGFFDQPDAEHVSAVIFSNSGTVAKFNRMGVLANFCPPDVLLIREGRAINQDPNAGAPLNFRHVVNAPGYSESWGEGLEVFHNPKAVHPVDPRALPGAVHHHLQSDGQVVSRMPEWVPLGSFTGIFSPVDVAAFLARLAQED